MDQHRLFFSSLNLQYILGIKTAEAMQLAQKASENLAMYEHSFETRIKREGELARKSDSRTPDCFFANWQSVNFKVRELKAQFPNVIFGLFHYGEHRHVLVDLAVNQHTFVAPIAGKAFWSIYENRKIYNKDFHQHFNLLEVESLRVGRDLVKGIRGGHAPAIYIDGNMGPDGVHAKNGAVEVDFFGKRIRVKSGVKRLSKKFLLPVVPLFARVDENGKPCLSIGEPVTSSCSMMQNLYQQLEKHVSNDPSCWEFSACLHRWIAPEYPQNQPSLTLNSDNIGFVPNLELVRQYSKGENLFLVHIKYQKALKIPQWATNCVIKLFNSKKAMTIQEFVDGKLEKSRIKNLFDVLIQKELVLAINAH
jgi:lauroyl/myristoyl acyltransferase